MSRIIWGVDGYGLKSCLCEHCEVVFGIVDRETISHDCDTSLPRYSRRDDYFDESQRARDIELQLEAANIMRKRI